ncbi:major histocompatibility complex class I-related gene protein-like [Clarias gariepinus]
MKLNLQEMDITHSWMEVLLFLMIIVPQMSAITHTLQYLYTALTPGINVPEFTAVGLVDGQQAVYYDSNIRKTIPKTEWILKIGANNPDYWEDRTQRVHTLQRMYGCELDDDCTTRGYNQVGYDGEDFISLDLRTGTWTAANDKAMTTKQKWESTGAEIKYWKYYLEKECFEWLKKFLSYGRETLERRVRPEVSVFQKHSPSPEVVCHATGFFPKAVIITWQKDGEDVHGAVELRETLPNQDGSFQKRIILKVPAEELQKHTYTCVVHPSGRQQWPGDQQIYTGGAPIAIIVAVTALLTLSAVVAGIMVWKKKNFDWKILYNVTLRTNLTELIAVVKVDNALFFRYPANNTEKKRADLWKRSLQLLISCDEDDVNLTRAYMKFISGNSFITFHLKNESWTMSDDQAAVIRRSLDPEYAQNAKDILQKECVYWDEQNSRENHERKDNHTLQNITAIPSGWTSTVNEKTKKQFSSSITEKPDDADNIEFVLVRQVENQMEQ